MRILLVISLLFVVQIKAQVGLGLEYQRNVECIRLSDFEDLLLSNSSFLLTKSKGFYRLAYGLEIQEALMGQFGGFYVFGLTSDIDLSLKNHYPLNYLLKASTAKFKIAATKKDITIFDQEINSDEISNLNALITKITDYLTQVK